MNVTKDFIEMMKNHRVLLRGKNKYFLRPAVLLTGVRSALVLSRRIYSSWGAETDVRLGSRARLLAAVRTRVVDREAPNYTPYVDPAHVSKPTKSK